jgi:hypothetical protein
MEGKGLVVVVVVVATAVGVGVMVVVVVVGSAGGHMPETVAVATGGVACARCWRLQCCCSCCARLFVEVAAGLGWLGVVDAIGIVSSSVGVTLVGVVVVVVVVIVVIAVVLFLLYLFPLS